MQINVTFDTVDEMKQFCQLVGGREGDKPKLSELIEGKKEPAVAVSAYRDVPAGTSMQQNAPTPNPSVTRQQTSAASTTIPTAPVQAPGQQAPVNQMSVPTSAQSYTLDDLSRAAITLLDSGHQQAELQQLLAQFGVAALPMLPEAQYGAFATALRGLGAKI